MDEPKLELIRAALPLFGRNGFEAASTRQLAGAAGRPISAITYHFGGKEGLYLACAGHIRDTIGNFILEAIAAQESEHLPSKARAREQLSELFGIVLGALLGETADITRFMLREQQEPTAAFDIIWGGIMCRVLGRMTDLVQIVAGDRLSEEEAKVRVVSLMGQVMVFRAAHAALLRHTGWSKIGTHEQSLIQAAVQDNLRCILSSLEEGYQ